MVYTKICIIVLMCVTATGVGSAGTFKDSNGESHSWQVTESHALLWDGSPFVPFGMVFQPQYLAEAQTEDNWARDERFVAALKSAGVQDVWVKPGVKLSSLSAEALQKVIDFLESVGLRYGIELYEPLGIPLKGYVIEPSVNRQEGIREASQISRTFPGAGRVLCVMCEASGGEVQWLENAVADAGGQVSVNVQPRKATDHVVLFYPQKVVGRDVPEGMPDIWNGYDRGRDGLILLLRQLKFGRGLRFFANPFTRGFGFAGEASNLFPTSESFQLEYAEWLSQKYKSPRDITVGWAILKHDVASFKEAARLVPLWREGRGVAAVYDESTGASYAVDATRSRVWTDFLKFRSESVAQYMDRIADVLKRTVADVPVVFTANGLEEIFRTTGEAGYDGLGVPASVGEVNVLSAGRVLSLAESSPAHCWIIAEIGVPGGGYQAKDAFFGVINGLRDLGAKGFFVELRGGEDSAVAGWLSEYASIGSGSGSLADYRPHVIYFPSNLPDGQVKRISGGVWWVPTLTEGVMMDVGPSLMGYALPNPVGGADIYVWSREGSQRVSLNVVNEITVIDSSGDEKVLTPKKGRVEFTVDVEPIVVRGVTPEQFIPVEMVLGAIRRLEEMIKKAEARHLEVGVYKRHLGYAREMVKKNQLALCLDLVRTDVAEIEGRLRALEQESGSGEAKFER